MSLFCFLYNIQIMTRKLKQCHCSVSLHMITVYDELTIFVEINIFAIQLISLTSTMLVSRV